MKDTLIIAPWFKILCYILIAIGVIGFAVAFITNPWQAWANYLLNNYYFLSLAIGASFFLAIQYITQSGWSAGFKRVPEAMSQYIPFAAVLFVLLFFGLHNLYPWSRPATEMADPVLIHRHPYLNIPFFMIRLVLYFGIWILMTRILRKLSLKEDSVGGMEYFTRYEYTSRIYIFLLAITFTLACFDFVLSIEPHWYSTIYAFKNFLAAFYHGSAIFLLITVILHKKGHFEFFNRNHLQDMSSYVFMLSIIYGYLWFSQFMLIWYGNLPEETAYVALRWQPYWKPFFWADIIINWFIPFAILMPKKPARRLKVVIPIVILLIFGQWIDLYLQIFPGIDRIPHFGWIEVATFLGFAGLFALVVSRALAAAPLVPRNHPYLGECLDHHIA